MIGINSADIVNILFIILERKHILLYLNNYGEIFGLPERNQKMLTSLI